MKIAQVCPYDIDRPGGVQIHIRDMAVAFAEVGHEVTIIAPNMGDTSAHAGEVLSPGVKVVRLGRARKIRFGGTSFEISLAMGEDRAALKALMRDGGFDVVHYHTMWTPLMPMQAFLQSSAPAVCTFHDTPAESATGAALKILFRGLSAILIPRLDGLITPSESPKAHLSSNGRAVHVLPPAIDLMRFSGTPRMEAAAGGRIQILFLGRLEERKGAKLLLEAFANLSRDGLPVSLTIAGTGPEEGALRQFAAPIPHVTFLGGFSRDATPALFAGCDIFCAPAPYGESFGLVVTEAMASARPVVAAANRGYSTLLKDEAAQFLTAPGNVDAIAAALQKLVQDSALRTRLGAWGRKAALAYDCRAQVPRFLAVYDEAIRHKRRH